MALEREMKDDSPIALSCSSKDKTLIMTKMESGASSFLEMNGNINIEFGCGIGPKVVMSTARNGMMAIASQVSNKREVVLYEMIFN